MSGWSLTLVQLTDRFGFSSVGGTQIVWKEMGDVAGTDKRHTGETFLSTRGQTESGGTYAGSERLPSSREASSALTGFPGSRGTECLSKECSTVPPLPRSLWGQQSRQRSRGRDATRADGHVTVGSSRPGAALDGRGW